MEEREHRRVAAETYNATWELLEADRSPAQDLELIGLALTSRHHWGVVGGAREKAIADWMASRCFAALGAGDLAVRFADAALAAAPDASPAWLTASLHEGRARAATAAGDALAREEHLALALGALETETDEQDRAQIAAQIADVPQI